jgi:hypothetical protein
VLNPRADEPISGNYQIRGAARSEDFIRYTVEWGRGLNPSSWVQIRSSNTQVAAGVLAAWDTTLVPDGQYTIRVLLQDSRLGTRQYAVNVIVINGDQGAVGDYAPVVIIDAPLAESRLSGNVAITGTAGSGDIEALIVEVGAGFSPTEWSVIEQRDQSVANSLLAAWDTTSVEDGGYVIRVTVRDRTFGTAQASVFVVVRNED